MPLQTTTPEPQAVSTAKEIVRFVELELPSGESLKTQLAITMEEQTQGLSGIQDKDFADNEAMLFIYLEDSPKRFWMPDTYFDLDIFFLDNEMVVIDVDRQVKHHPGRENLNSVARTRAIYCRHVLEIKSSSKLAQQLRPGMKLKWPANPPLWQIERDIRQSQ